MYKLEKTKQFEKALKKLSGNEQRAVAGKLKIMVEDPFHPSLRTKKVQRLKDVFECSVNMDVRILWMHKGRRLILLIDIGHHDILP
jgi:mRNA-degrading endonuclease YafQ of YafQ-DinJ toxin-antitoxin module